MRYGTIYDILVSRLRTFAGWSDAGCAWPGRPYTPGTTAYWKVDLLPTGVDAALGVGGSIHEEGIFQISRIIPSTSGIGSALASLDALAGHFDRQILSATGCTITTDVPAVGPIAQAGDWTTLPLSIVFRAL